MILFHNAAGQRKSQSPPSFLCGKPRPEHGTQMLLGDALARIGNFNVQPAAGTIHINGNAALPAHGVDGILAKILYHPLEERAPR